MGDTPSKYNKPLPMQANPIAVVDQRFCSPQEVTLHLKEKIFSLSGEDFKIKDKNTGQVWFQIKGKVLSLRNTKTLFDVFGNPVLNIKESFLKAFIDYKVYLGDKSAQELFKVVAKLNVCRVKAYTTVTDRVSNQQFQITIKGDLFAMQACIYIGEAKHGGIPIAKIYRPVGGARDVILDKTDYYLTVAPNVDISFCVALCICLDEMSKEH